MLYTPKIYGQVKNFRRTMLAHLQGISPSAGVPHAIFLVFFGKKYFNDFSVLVLLFASNFHKFYNKNINNKKNWGSWNSVTIHSNIRKEPSGYANGTFKLKN